MNIEGRTPSKFQIDEPQKQRLHRAACRLIRDAVCGQRTEMEKFELGPLADIPVVGVFVTLRKAGQLRGCIGNFTESIPLGKALWNAATGVATSDPRFQPVRVDELPDLTVEISLLHSRQLLPPVAERRRASIEIGRHGLDLQYAGRKGLLLPQVPVEWGWDVDQFLEAVCRKAGLNADAWKDPAADLYRFEATYFGAPFDDSR